MFIASGASGETSRHRADRTLWGRVDLGALGALHWCRLGGPSETRPEHIAVLHTFNYLTSSKSMTNTSVRPAKRWPPDSPYANAGGITS